MTPKQAYEQRKAERKLQRDAAETLGRAHTVEGLELLEVFDRIATSFERIADVLEDKPRSGGNP